MSTKNKRSNPKKRKHGETKTQQKLKVPSKIMKSLKARHDTTDKEVALKHLNTMIRFVVDTYSGDEENHIWFWAKPEREAAVVISENRLLDADVMDKIFDDMKKCDIAFEEMSDSQRNAYTAFPQLLTKCFEEVTKEEFANVVDKTIESNSMKVCKELQNMVSQAIVMIRDKKVFDKPLHDLGNFKDNVVADILRMFFNDLTITPDQAAARLEMIKQHMSLNS